MDIKRMLASAPKDRDLGEPRPLLTPWGEKLDPYRCRSEHPRPQFARDQFTSLNGFWRYAIVAATSDAVLQPPEAFDGRILVPFSPEALLSGVRRQLLPGELLWYEKTFEAPRLREGERCLLHFEAVDYACACWVNGRRVGTHEGGYLPFTFDITDALAAAGEGGGEGAGEGGPADGDSDGAHSVGAPPEGSTCQIALCVRDATEQAGQLRGKQRLARGGIWYTAQSGIWQPVWLEVVPERHVRALGLHPDAATSRLGVDVEVAGETGLVRLYVTDDAGRAVGAAEARVEEGSTPVAERPGAPLRRLRLDVPLEAVRLWSPDDPALYHLTVRFGTDVVYSYTAFRTIEVRAGDGGRARVFLNGEPLLVRGVLDQGYWSDGLMTAPDDEAFVHDIQAMKDAGFNMLRKHLKVEADRWYYHCDRLGMLVWQDMVSGGGAYDSWETSFKPTLWRGSWGRYDDRAPEHQAKLGGAEAPYQKRWLVACRRTVDHLRNHPCVACWCLFNEGWGQFDAVSAAEKVHRLDPTRPIDATSGWYDQHAGDFQSVHNYFRKLKVYRDRPLRLAGYVRERGSRAFALSEFGGAVLAVPDHSAYRESYGYGTFDSAEEWRREVARQLDEAAALEARGLSVFVYTQLSDVEEETNGLLTYDRKVNKLKEGYDA